MTEPAPESDAPLLFRPATGGELAFAFCGSIVVGAISPTIPAVFSTSPSDFLAASMAGGILGLFWGFLTFIMTAAVESEHRRATTLWMFAIHSIFAMVVGQMVMISVSA